MARAGSLNSEGPVSGIHFRPWSFRPLDFGDTGCSAAWLARVLWVHEVAGSSPASPTYVIYHDTEDTANLR